MNDQPHPQSRPPHADGAEWRTAPRPDVPTPDEVREQVWKIELHSEMTRIIDRHLYGSSPRPRAAVVADAVMPVVAAALTEQAQTLRAVEIDRDQWRDRAHHWQATAGPPEDSEEYDLDTDPDAVRRNLGEVITFLDGRGPKMIHDAVWARVRPVLRIFREKLAEQRQRAEQAERERDEALAAVAEEQGRADDRRTELLEERDQALYDLEQAEAALTAARDETAQQRQRADALEVDLRQERAVHEQTVERAEKAEADADRIDELLIAERGITRREQLRADHAEAAVQRSREALAAFDGRGVSTPEGTDWNIPTAGEVLEAWRTSLAALGRPADPPAETTEPEHTGGNAEDCPVCRPLIDQPGGVLYPWHCTAAEQPADPPAKETS